MNTSEESAIVRQNSIEDFEFVEKDNELDIDLSHSPVSGACDRFHRGVSMIITALCTLVEEEKLEVKVCMSSVVTAAVGAVTGSLLGGPAGLTVGLLTGAIMAYRTSPNRTKRSSQGSSGSTIRQIFSKMTMQEKKDLVKELLLSLKHTNVRTLLVDILKNEKIRNTVLSILSDLLLKKMGVSLVRAGTQ